MAVVKSVPPFLDIEAIMSVFNDGVPTFSSKTTIREVVGTVVEVNGSDIIVDEVADAEICGTPQPTNKT